jgi:hypothetical protein
VDLHVSARRLALAIVLGAAALLLAPRAAAAQLLSPGPLAEAHKQIDGDDHCGACHRSGKQVVASLCLDCHEDLRRRIDAGAGLHGRAYRGRACEDCHHEHIGRKTKLVRWPGGSMDALDHELTGWKLEGDHRQVKCLECHDDVRAGKPTFLAARPECASCHKDPHAGRLGARCQGCHDSADWSNFDRRAFDHAKTRYPLTGRHLPVECEKCHGTPAKWTGLAFDTCEACHDDPHDGGFVPKPCTACHATAGWADAAAKVRGDHPGLSLAAGHRKVTCERCHDRGNTRPPSKGARCVACHPTVHEAPFGDRCEGCHAGIRWLGLADAVGRRAHARTVYPLAGKHVGVACAGCHPPKLPAAKRFRALTHDRCAACHADRHAGEFAARDGGECGACHRVDGFTPTTFGVSAHASTVFALDGRHTATPCRGCHGEARPRLDLRVGKRACAECHADPHGGQFARELAQGGCAQCHATAGWERPRIDHSSWPLEGLHAGAACASCHPSATGGAGASYRGIPRTCEGCHDDVHAGQFAQRPPARTCDRCHQPAGFALPAFDHRAASGFALDGAHGAAACAGCHPTVELRNGARAVSYRLGYRGCRDCHADPHGAATGGALIADLDCSACHDTAGWTMAGPGNDRMRGFDHDRTGFPLRGAHEARACGDCHRGQGKPAATCEGCHRDPHQGRVDGACAECHTAAAWSDTGLLARHRRTRMPLTGRHATIDCVACHQRGGDRTWTGLPTDCWSCHAADYTRPTIHPHHDGDPTDPSRPPLPRDCARCHRTSGWQPALASGWLLARTRPALAADHDARFVLSTVPHRDAACASCHVDARPTARVRCDGCHPRATLRGQHRGVPPAIAGSTCLRCHPRGGAR